MWPWAAWRVMTVSKVRRISKSSDGGGETSAAVATSGSRTALLARPAEEEGVGTEPESSDLGCLEPAQKWAALYLRKDAPKGAITWTGLEEGKPLRSR